MLSVPYSRYIFGIIPWYSFLVVLGAALAILLAMREEKKGYLKKDTVIDFALIALPCGIIGARIYYVAFSWDSFRGDFLSVFRVWEGGIAIYGGIIAGLLAAIVFCRVRRISFLTLCDVFAPGLILAQAIGRWGNYFNQEAYGLPLQDSLLCFFPFAVQIRGETGLQWHMATFFYESSWNFLVFIFLIAARRKWFRYSGDVFFFYAYLYACGRMIVENFRMDSLYAAGSLRISQLLSVLICMAVLSWYFFLFRKHGRRRPFPVCMLFSLCMLFDFLMAFVMSGIAGLFPAEPLDGFLFLLACAVLNILALFVLYGKNAEGDLIYADNKN